jgi:parallel beta-helix repeat protein
MTSTVFADKATVIQASWLNDVNTVTYGELVYSSLQPSLQAAVTAAAGKVLYIDTNQTVSTQLTVAANTKIVCAPGVVITLAVSDIGLKLTGDNITIDGLVIAGVSSRAIGTANASGLSNIRILNCDISGATIVGAGYSAGIFLDGVTNAWVENNYLHGNGRGAQTNADNCDILVYTAVNRNVHIEGNRCASTSVSYGIACYTLTNSFITDNDVSGALCGASNNNGYGITVYDAIGSTTYRNVISGNVVKDTQGTGIYVVSSSFIDVIGNICINNGTTQSDVSLAVGGIAFNSCSDVNITGNVVSDGGKDGIAGAVNTDSLIANNTIASCAGHGVNLRGTAARFGVLNNLIRACLYNIYSDATAKTFLNIADNQCHNALAGSDGINIISASDSALVNNTVAGSALSGITWGAGSRNRVSGNICRDNSTAAANVSDGLNLSLTNSVVEGNHTGNSGATGQRYGISSNGNYCTFNDNVCVRNQTDGLNLSGTAVQRSGNRMSTSSTPGATSGSAVLVAGTVTVSTDEVRTGDLILLTCTTAGGTQGFPRISAIVNGTSFTITSSNGADTSTYAWLITH